MRPSVRIPVHRPTGGGGFSEEDEARFVDRPCYVFNRSLAAAFDDRHCGHCRHYLTPRCPHFDEFVEDVEELGPE